MWFLCTLKTAIIIQKQKIMDLIDWGHRRGGAGVEGGVVNVEPLILLGFCVMPGEGDTGKLRRAPAIC